MIRRFQLADAGEVRYFEVLIKTTGLSGTTKGMELMAHRILTR
jgi:hypothetical protein